jgi:N6-adenosine-specific RNA methylase IME4
VSAITGGPYDVIYADPPWRFAPMFKSATYSNDQENHYPTMSIQDIRGLEVPAARNAVLFLWVTSPHLHQGLGVVDAWGFTYKASAIWAKPSPGTGYWWRNQHEFLLVATRGRYPAPKPKERAASLYFFPRERHSKKPDAIRDQIRDWWPGANRLELFARQRTDGWTAWGNQVPAAVSA